MQQRIESDSDAITSDDRDFVTALASGLEVIRAFDAQNARMTLTEVAARTGMNRARARRFLLTLHALGYVRKEGRHFALSPKVLQLGYSYLSANQFRLVIQQYLEDITEAIGESSSLGVLDGSDIVYVARSAAQHRLMGIDLAVGTRLPATHTSMGRVLLAQLDDDKLRRFIAEVSLEPHTRYAVTDRDALWDCLMQVREQGYAIVDQELEHGLRSLAVPVYDGHDHLLGAINVSTNAARIDMDTLTGRFLALLRETAEAIHQRAR